MIQCFVLAALLFGATVGSATAKVHRASDPNPKKFQDAIDTAAYGDTVLVAPGTYSNVHLRPGITLRSEKGPETTILRSGQLFVVKAEDVDSLTVIEGFTLDGVKACQYVVDLTDSPLTIRNCVIKNGWAGIQASKSSLRSQNVTISNCQNGYFLQESGGEIIETDVRRCVTGIHLESSSPRILRSTITGNSLGIEIVEHSDPSIGGSLATANRIYGNPGGAIKNEAKAKENGMRLLRPHTIAARYNFWGSNCPDSTNFRGPILWAPWVDESSKKSLDRCVAAASK